MFQMTNDPEWLLRMAALDDGGFVTAGDPSMFRTTEEVWDEEWDELLKGVNPE